MATIDAPLPKAATVREKQTIVSPVRESYKIIEERTLVFVGVCHVKGDVCANPDYLRAYLRLGSDDEVTKILDRLRTKGLLIYDRVVQPTSVSLLPEEVVTALRGPPDYSFKLTDTGYQEANRILAERLKEKMDATKTVLEELNISQTYYLLRDFNRDVGDAGIKLNDLEDLPDIRCR
jgi:hypothetical protein